MKKNSLLVEKTHSIGMHVLRLLLLTLQFEVELLLALHSLQVKAIPVGVST